VLWRVVRNSGATAFDRSCSVRRSRTVFSAPTPKCTLPAIAGFHSDGSEYVGTTDVLMKKPRCVSSVDKDYRNSQDGGDVTHLRGDIDDGSNPQQSFWDKRGRMWCFVAQDYFLLGCIETGIFFLGL
jgi:hypothetical protein